MIGCRFRRFMPYSNRRPFAFGRQGDIGAVPESVPIRKWIRESCPGSLKRSAHMTRMGRSSLAHGGIYPELRTTLEFNQGCPARQRATLAALCPFLAGDRAAAKFAGGSVEPTAGSAGRPPLLSPSRLTPEERLQVLVCVRHPSSVIKDLIHPRKVIAIIMPFIGLSRSFRSPLTAFNSCVPGACEISLPDFLLLTEAGNRETIHVSCPGQAYAFFLKLIIKGFSLTQKDIGGNDLQRRWGEKDHRPCEKASPSNGDYSPVIRALSE